MNSRDIVAQSGRARLVNTAHSHGEIESILNGRIGSEKKRGKATFPGEENSEARHTSEGADTCPQRKRGSSVTTTSMTKTQRSCSPNKQDYLTVRSKLPMLQ